MPNLSVKRDWLTASSLPQTLDGTVHFWSRVCLLLKRRREPEPQIRVVEGGFDLVSQPNRTIVSRVRWSEVTKILTYKIDLLTTDCICLLFELSNGQHPIQVSEEWEGFTELFTPMTENFPSIPQNWYLEVMFPAFETKQSIIYESVRTN